MSELDEAKRSLKKILRWVVKAGTTHTDDAWAEIDAELDWAIDQIVRVAAEKGRGQVQ